LLDFSNSKFFIIIFSLTTFIIISSDHLEIVNSTLVQAGHFIQETTSFNEFSLLTSLPFTFFIMSHHFIHDFSAGHPGNGEVIVTIQGLVSSTYEPIHSYSHSRFSSKLLLSVGGK
jgi:hypothetical protein